MKKILTAAIALSVLVSAGAASAQSYQGRDGGYHAPRDDRRDERRDERRGDRYERRDDRDGRHGRYERSENRYERRYERRYNAGRYYAPRGYQARQWRRGEHLPPQYRGQAYRVDYRRYRLPPPPRGYQYTRVNDDVVLTAIATGLIASVVFNMFQ